MSTGMGHGANVSLVLGDTLCKRSFSFILFVPDIQTDGSIEPSVSVGRAI